MILAWILDVGYLIVDNGCQIFEITILEIMSYKKLIFWQLARDLSIKIHKMSLELPRFEQFEEGQQIRRSAKSTRSNIVEGYGRRMYKQEFIRYIIFALASNLETQDHMDTLFETGSLTNQSLYNELVSDSELLGGKLGAFLEAIKEGHNKGDS